MPRRPLLHALFAIPALLVPVTAATQGAHEHAVGGWAASGMMQALPLVTRATPTAHGRSLTEAYVAQPILGGSLSGVGGRVTAVAMLNLEGLTLARGELTTGTYGEGFVDRRHPHSYVHELVAAASTDLRVGRLPVALSLAGGRGFAPFGSDDPMVRPFAKYPVNHHLAQILERVVLIGAARSGPLTVEGAIFNGDEPTSPSSDPLWSRFGDSWSTRATLRPVAGLEISGSLARVESPEFREGLGLDQRKRSLVVRFEKSRPDGAASRYLLAEWARTYDDRRGRVAFTYSSFLAEGAYCARRVWGGVRFERTTRPEEERLFDPFRTPRPQIEFAILGRSRWTNVTVAAGTNPTRAGVLSLAPFVEATYAHPASVEELTAFVPRDFYRSDRLWLLSAGARVNVGPRHQRMGRYGAADRHQSLAPRGHHSTVTGQC